MGCRLYLAARLHVILCGVSGGAAKESHPRRKGCSVIPLFTFISKILSITPRTSRKTWSSTAVVPRKTSIRLPRVGHSCIVLGFTIGESRSGIRPPPHTYLSRRMTWRTTAGVKCTSHDPPSFSSHPATGAGHPPAGHGHIRGTQFPSPSGGLPCHEPPRARTLGSDGQHGARGGKEVSRRARIRTPIPPPSFMLALRTSWPGGWEFGDRKLPGGREPGGHRRVRGRAGACADGLTEWLLFVGGSWGIYYAGASPLYAPSKELTCR